MTVEEKVGQLVQLNAALIGKSTAEITGPLQKLGIDDQMLKEVGSTLNFHGVEEMKEIQDKHMAESRLGIPLLFMMDVIHGYRTIFPIPLALGGSFDPSLVSECSKMAAKEASAGGVQVTFTPMVDYVRDARWGRVMETCGEDAYLNSVMGAAQVKAFQGHDLSDPDHLATCVKHFAAYGGAEAGRDYNTVEISERLLREYYLPAYKACLDAGAVMIMPSFNSLNGVPAVINQWLMQDVLKKEWNYHGLVISDYNAIGEVSRHGICDDMKEITRRAFENGCHIDMMSSAYCNHLVDLVKEGAISEATLDEAVFKVLELKKMLGLFEDPYHGASSAKENALCLCEEHRQIARKAAEECAVLLKNNGVLPFSKDVQRVAIIGPFAASRAIKGFWACNGKDEDCISVYEGISSLLPHADIRACEGCSPLWDCCLDDGIDEAVLLAQWADAVIICLGEPQNYSGEGNSRTDISLPGSQEKLAERVLAVNANAAVVLFNGRPLELSKIDQLSPAVLDMWFPGTEGGNAVARLLFGDANPCGKVSMSFPKAVGQCPIYYNHPSTGRPKRLPEEVHQPYASNYIDCGNLPLYSFGHGLSYANFVYESLWLDKDTLTKDSEITVTVTLRNQSDRAGKEVVQLYIRDLWASTVRPIQSLIGFEKIELQPGQVKTVSFKITEPMLRFYDFACNHISEPGEFTVSTGYADHLILSKGFVLM